MPRRAIPLLLCAFFAALLPASSQVIAPDSGGNRIGDRETPAGQEEAARRLAEITPLLAATARRYENYALRFLCTETHRTIDYSRTYGVARSDKETAYDYLLTLDPKNSSFEVIRQLLDEKKLPTGGETTIDLPCPEPYLWSFLFLPTYSSSVRLTYLGREIQQYRLTHAIGFEGSSPRTEGRDLREWSGTVWVEENTGNIVRIEARPTFQNERMLAQWREYQQAFVLPFAIRAKARPHGYVLAVVFDYERDGLLFPSRLDLSDFVWLATNRETMDTRLVLSYGEYRFFKTEAQETVDQTDSPKR